jgi:hypothetical protein
MQALRPQYPGGPWRNLECKAPSGETHRIYVSPEQNGKQRATALATRSLQASFKAVHPDLQTFANKRFGRISSGWARVAEVVVFKDRPPAVRFNNAGVQKKKVDQAAILRHFRSNAFRSEQVDEEWGPLHEAEPEPR